MVSVGRHLRIYPGKLPLTVRVSREGRSGCLALPVLWHERVSSDLAGRSAEPVRARAVGESSSTGGLSCAPDGRRVSRSVHGVVSLGQATDCPRCVLAQCWQGAEACGYPGTCHPRPRLGRGVPKEVCPAACRSPSSPETREIRCLSDVFDAWVDGRIWVE